MSTCGEFELNYAERMKSRVESVSTGSGLKLDYPDRMMSQFGVDLW